MSRLHRVVGTLAVAVLSTSGLCVSVASAHENGQVELYVATLNVVHDQAGYRVTVGLVDRDSGSAAGGFTTAIAATSNRGNTLPATVLDGAGNGQYGGSLALSPGTWTLVVAAEQGSSTIAAIASSRSFSIEVRADGSLAAHHGSSSAVLTLVLVIVALIGAALVTAFGIRSRRRGRKTEARI